jgi:S-adenosylmethionine decarboxylase
MDRSHFGWHAIINISGSVSQLNGYKLLEVMENAAHAGGAKILNSNVHSFGEGLGDAGEHMGYTGVVMLAESHMSVHTWPESNFAAFDIFMCSDKESVEKAILVITEACENITVETQLIARGLNCDQ